MMPIEIPQHLETIAEVAAAFTGFAGLLNVLGKSKLDPKVRFWRVRLMIITGLAAMFGALTPPSVSLLTSQEAVLWRLSSFVPFLLMSGQLIYVYRFMPMEHASGLFRVFYSPFASALTIGSLVFQVCLIAITAGFILRIAPAVYSIALVILLVASAFHFLKLVIGSQPHVVT